MTDEMLQQYTTLVYFLGSSLGPDHEITLYDLEAGTYSVAAIANGRISGQTIGSPLPDVARELLSQRRYEQGDYVLNFTSRLQATGKTIRSSAMFIKDAEGKTVGLLGINFDDSRFLSLSDKLLDLIHPSSFVQEQYGSARTSSASAPIDAADGAAAKEPIFNNVSSMIQEIFEETTRSLSVPVDRMNQEERVAFIARLKERGMFRLKGAVQFTAENLNCSQASVYRYLSKVKV